MLQCIMVIHLVRTNKQESTKRKRKFDDEENFWVITDGSGKMLSNLHNMKSYKITFPPSPSNERTNPAER